ncbi:MAG: hypothetical protein ACYTFI_19695, partial [Planctomycetota bacterium]
QRIAELPRFAEARRMAEARPPVQPGSICKVLGGIAMAPGGFFMLLYPFYEMGAPQEEADRVLHTGLGLLAAGGLLWLYGERLDYRNSKRTQFSIAPNGCRFTYRF